MRLAVVLFLLAVPGLARAVFHQDVIDEVVMGLNGDSAAQYVEIRMLADGQTSVTHTVLSFFSCNGLVVTNIIPDMPHDIANGGAGVRWSMGTQHFANITGVTPDFIFPAVTNPPSPAPPYFPCGMVCWGAPSSGGPPPTNPASWSHTNRDNFVDCVAYGGYTGTRQTSDAAATTLNPGDGTNSLQRMGDTGNDANDFALASPTPTNNTASAATTTTTPGATTTTVFGPTTTTLPSGGTAPNLVPGGGPAKSDCYVELAVQGATAIKANKVVSCRDGDPCDADGVPDGTCTFKVALCPNQSLSGCTPHPPITLSGTSVAPAGPLTPPTDLAGSACGPSAGVKVALKGKNHNKPGKTVLHVKAKVTGAKPKTDADNVKLICTAPPGT